jgi:hypothetical protein
MKTRLIVLFLLAGAVALAGPRVVVGFGVGAGYPFYGYAATFPGFYAVPGPSAPFAFAPYPGFGYTWIRGYWYPFGARFAWRPGYWARPPFWGARWVAPRFYGGRFHRGHWRR